MTSFVLHMNSLQKKILFLAQKNIHSILIIVIIIIIENVLSGTETRSRRLFTNERRNEKKSLQPKKKIKSRRRNIFRFFFSFDITHSLLQKINKKRKNIEK